MADGNVELNQLRQSEGASIRPSGLVALVALSTLLLLIAALAACGNGDDAPENGGAQSTQAPADSETRDPGENATLPAGRDTPEPEYAKSQEPDGEETTKGEFVSVSVSGHHTRGVLRDGSVQC